jgi:hypothetical protein
MSANLTESFVLGGILLVVILTVIARRCWKKNTEQDLEEIVETKKKRSRFTVAAK